MEFDGGTTNCGEAGFAAERVWEARPSQEGYRLAGVALERRRASEDDETVGAPSRRATKTTDPRLGATEEDVACPRRRDAVEWESARADTAHSEGCTIQLSYRLTCRLVSNLRQMSVPDAVDGVPAHVTLLYPFVGRDGLDALIRGKIESVAARHAPFDFTMTGPAQWPDTIYVAVEPIEPFVRLQADLAAAFPDYPIYGEGSDFEFTPHITVAGANGRA